MQFIIRQAELIIFYYMIDFVQNDINPEFTESLKNTEHFGCSAYVLMSW